MTLTRDHLRRIILVAHARDAGFVDLVGMAELDPSTAFRGAALRGADLRGEDLSGFNLTGANLDGVDLSGADLSLTVGLTPAMFSDTRYNAATRFPSGFPNPFWAPGKPPGWAEDWGIDAYGKWVSFGVGAGAARVTPRLRWIPPGGFTIGAPPSEDGSRDSERPQRDITIATGFWLFDTPCTQALWHAVTGNNPSRFQSPTRPVEQVSFDDVRDFLERVNQRVPGLDLSLPSEAQWEYACRASTTEATYAGAMEIMGDHNAPVLDAIAWYGGNSGVGFELPNGSDSSGWADKQYGHTWAGTHPVEQKAPNQWGLYDMLGNVWEWCADAWHDSYADLPLDGSARDAPRGGAALRVFRGGSWLDEARLVRAACRYLARPADRNGDLGFRCARVQA
jgi:formylglycine-generating enzyme required for sulfatase activity